MPLPSNAQLTAHFTAGELRADDPTASAGIVANLHTVAQFLEYVRSALGVPLRVTSGYRPPDRNAAVGGASTSSHMDGLAADILPIGGPSMYGAYLALQRAALPPFDQIIYYPVQGHIHVGLGTRMRREIRINISPDPGGTPLLSDALLARLPGFSNLPPATVATGATVVTVVAAVALAAYLFT